MAVEILEYRFTSQWNLSEFVNDESFKQHIEPRYPIVASTLSTFTSDALHAVWSDYLAGKRRGKPSELRNSSNDSVVSFVGASLGTTGEIFRMEAACSSSLYAFYLAGLISQDKQSPVIVFAGDNLVGGYDSWYFQSMGAIDQETGRPFDDSSKGFRMGTGMCMYLVKHHSVKHSLPTMATIDDIKFYTNPKLVANPGEVDDVIRNLDYIDYHSIDLWNAHATGTPVGDKFEYTLFNRVIENDIPIIGYKGYVGHCMTAAGGAEIALCLDDMKSGILRPNVITGNKIVNDTRIITEPVKFTFKKILKTSLGFGGRTVVCTINIQ